MTSPPELRSKIARDLRPVRALPPPAIRALVLAPIALATVIAVPATHFFRSDMAALGFLRTWGFSAVEATCGLMIVALALRESIPGRALSVRALTIVFAAGLMLPFFLVVVNAESFSIGSPPGLEWSDAVGCFRVSSMSAVPALVVAAILAARALPLRAPIAGALYGLGCALIADAGLRLFCEFTAPSHVLAAHGGAILTVTVGGAILATVLRR